MDLRIREADEDSRTGVELWSYIQGYADAAQDSDWRELEEALTDHLIDRAPLSLETLDAELNRIADDEPHLWGNLRKTYLVAKALWLEQYEDAELFGELADLSTWENWLAEFRSS